MICVGYDFFFSTEKIFDAASITDETKVEHYKAGFSGNNCCSYHVYIIANRETLNREDIATKKIYYYGHGSTNYIPVMTACYFNCSIDVVHCLSAI